DGAWRTAKPDDLTIDLMEIGFWCEIAWLKLGDVTLPGGKHRLDIRIAKQTKPDGKPDRILYASDCICLHPGKFQPYSKYKPNEDHRTERDTEAATHVFSANDIQQPYHTYGNKSLYLSGTWEICRDDELLPEPVAQPISRLPETTRWSAIEVPGDKNTLRPDLQFAHRVWYRTKIDIPGGFHNHSGYIEFPQNNLNTTVYVNGQLCGFNKNPFAKFRIDISKAIKPGVNEIMVGIRDAWYARTEKPDDPMKLRRTFNIPKSYFSEGFQDLVYPIWAHPQSGILVAPTLHLVSGPVYVDDVFVKPSVANMELVVDVTLKNVSDKDHTVELYTECREIQVTVADGESEGAPTRRIVADEEFYGYAYMGQHVEPGFTLANMYDVHVPNAPAKRFERKTVTVKANSELVVHLKEKWEHPKLWTPSKPHLYFLQCNVRGTDESGKVFSSWNHGLNFGFREWSISGKDFLLNGVPFHGWADCFEQPTKEKWLQFYRDTNQSVMRFWGTKWQGMPPEETLRFFDENGVVCRRSGIFDGEAIGYNVIEGDPDLRAMNKALDPAKEEIKMDLFRNWRDQMVAQVKAERNHPSVMLWSLENEILYINCINLYGGLMDAFEDEILKTAQAVKEVDPTRTSMVDGGGATKRGNPGNEPGDGLEVAGDHYVVSDFMKYPDLAYQPYPEGGGRGRWLWDEKRPRFIGEDFYVNGYLPADFAAIGGEEAFQGRTGARKAVGILMRMLTEGYRWSEYGAWHFWLGQDRAVDQYHSNAPIAVFCKEWDWTFEAGTKVDRTFKIFNDTQKDRTIRFKFRWINRGQLLPLTSESFGRSGETTLNLKAGKSIEFPLPLLIPKENDLSNENNTMKGGPYRAEVGLLFTLETQGTDGSWTECFRDEKNVTIIAPRVLFSFLSAASYPPSDAPTQVPTGVFSLLVYDPNESITGWLDKQGITYKSIDSLENIPQGEYGKTILLVGKDAITPENCDSTALQLFASQGNGVIV
ncbi:MAG: hypothetical protein FWD31_13545, partial [Planctomycetaceae bacterium]|nr:hypothetical protein [Planctomycetaceae bacterium]